MIEARFVFERKTIYSMEEYFVLLPKKGEKYIIEGTEYKIHSFTLLGNLVIYSLIK